MGGNGIEQMDDGGTIGRQNGETDPTFSVWRTGDDEYWALYKVGQSGGFERPGPSNTPVDWKLTYTAPTWTTEQGFLDWIDTEYGYKESDMTVELYTLQTQTS